MYYPFCFPGKRTIAEKRSCFLWFYLVHFVGIARLLPLLLAVVRVVMADPQALHQFLILFQFALIVLGIIILMSMTVELGWWTEVVLFILLPEMGVMVTVGMAVLPPMLK